MDIQQYITSPDADSLFHFEKLTDRTFRITSKLYLFYFDYNYQTEQSEMNLVPQWIGDLDYVGINKVGTLFGRDSTSYLLPVSSYVLFILNNFHGGFLGFIMMNLPSGTNPETLDPSLVLTMNPGVFYYKAIALIRTDALSNINMIVDWNEVSTLIYNQSKQVYKTVILGETIAAFRVFQIDATGKAYKVSNIDTDMNSNVIVGLTIEAGVLNDQVLYIDQGITETNYSFTPGAKLYLGTTGLLTETQPSIKVITLGYAITASEVMFKVGETTKLLP
jgi:hypothetical protein